MRTRPSEAGVYWTRFYLEHRHSLIAYALSLTRHADDAQDLIQDVLARMVAEDRPVDRGRAYVLRCLRNLAIDRLRRRAVRPDQASPNVDAAAVIDAEAAEADRRETVDRVRAALRRLPEDYREVIVLKTYCQLTFREIAETLDLPQGTAASHYRRGLEELRALCAEATEDVS